jgi:glycosyltransferase involved in cell wall biosynthesis
MINVSFFFRKPSQGLHSIEELFGTIIKNLPHDITPFRITVPFSSNSILKKIANILYTPFYQRNINHITGDIHYISFFLAKRKTILTIHDLEIINRSSFFKRALILFFWFRLPARRVAYLTVISEFTKKELLSWTNISPDKIKVIPNCLPGKLSFDPQPFNEVCPVILQVGTKNNKNIPNLLNALKGLTCKLLILGRPDPAQLQLLKDFNIDYELFSNLTYEEVIQIYRRADLLAYVSTYEGFGLPILESQAIGRPVVTSNISSMPEVAGDAACFVDPTDINSIRAGILRIITDKPYRESLVSKGFMNVTRYKPEIISESYAALYRQVFTEYNSPV